MLWNKQISKSIFLLVLPFLDSENLVRMIFSEQRLQNADMRMSVKRLEDKLDDLMNKMDKPVQTGFEKKDTESDINADKYNQVKR